MFAPGREVVGDGDGDGDGTGRQGSRLTAQGSRLKAQLQRLARESSRPVDATEKDTPGARREAQRKVAQPSPALLPPAAHRQTAPIQAPPLVIYPGSLERRSPVSQTRQRQQDVTVVFLSFPFLSFLHEPLCLAFFLSPYHTIPTSKLNPSASKTLGHPPSAYLTPSPPPPPPPQPLGTKQKGEKKKYSRQS